MERAITALKDHSKNPAKAEKRATFHHGDLRNALLEAARKMVEENGLEKLSLRGVARAAGVSEAAPYNHFENRNDLLAAVAALGFRDLQTMTERELARDDSSLSDLDKTGVIYVEFAIENPELFRLMFGRQRGEMDEASSELRSNSASVYDDLERRSRDEIVADPAASEPAKDLYSLRNWSLVHGLALLIIDRGIKPSDYGFHNSRALAEALFDDNRFQIKMA